MHFIRSIFIVYLSVDAIGQTKLCNILQMTKPRLYFVTDDESLH